MTFTTWEDPSTPLLTELVEKLEENGLNRDEYLLHDFVDPGALQSLIASDSSVTVSFTVRGIRLTVTPDGVTATESSKI